MTRPQAESEALAAQLRARGHAVIIAPLSEIVWRPVSLPDLATFQATLITSANGARALARLVPAGPVLTPVYAVGEASAAAARAEGFRVAGVAQSSVQSLGALLAHQLAPAAGPLLYLSGEEVAGNLAADLGARGFRVTRVAAYAAQAAPTLPAPARDALASGALDGILFLSPRAARIFHGIVTREGLAAALQGVTGFCLSAAIAAALRELPFRAVRVAGASTLASLLTLLEGPLDARN
ncbi:MAG: uroporphyrinogen-III synthase [Alphaproteobacteria bacterium]|nr:uroporphyrinogen-III synthase [Alphaproteobacteria bacterium]